MDKHYALFGPLIEQSHNIYFLFDCLTHQFRYVSPAARDMLGVEPAAADTALAILLSQIHPDDKSYVSACLRNVRNTGYLDGVDMRMRRPEVGIQSLCLTLAYHKTEEEEFISGIVRDNTHIREYLENVDRFNKKKNATLEILSHDLAGPFTMMEQLTGYLGEKVAPLEDDMVNQMLVTMKNTCHDSINLIRDFVDNEFMASANVKMTVERVELVSSLQDMLEEYQRSASHLAKTFALKSTSPTIYAELDNNKFMQVINNLISNAVKFTPDGGRIELQLQQDQDDVWVSVADNGIGIPAHLQPVLFERFTPARRQGLRGEKTNGLGMSIIKTIVDLHQGHIECASTEDVGTTITIKLPHRQPKPAFNDFRSPALAARKAPPRP